MESEDIPGTISQSYETIGSIQVKNVKKKLKGLSDAEADFDKFFAIGDSKDQHQEAIEPTGMSDEKSDEIHEIEGKLKSNHFETFMKLSKFNIYFGWIVGLAVHDYTWVYHKGTGWTKFLLIFSTLITMYSHLVVISEPAKLIEVFSIFGMIAPAFLKFNLFVKSTKKILSANSFLEEIFKVTVDGSKALVLKQHIDESFTNIKLFVIIQTISLIIFGCYPIYGFIVNNELIPIMPMKFPFLDQTTTFGYIFSNLLMLKMGIWAYSGCVAFDLYLARIIYNYTALVKLIQQDLLEFTDMYKNVTNKYSAQYKNQFLRNILIKSQDKDRYIQFINSIFAKIIFQHISILYVCLTFTIYAILRSNWYSGYGFLMFCLAEMWSLCILGTSIKTENDNLCFAIYNMPWYEFPISTQKCISTLLHSSQNAMELWIGPFAPLNVETGLQLTKNMYSTSTMIMNTSE